MASVQKTDEEGLQVIHAALWRMGTMSLARAYTILGYRVNHGVIDDSLKANWNGLEKASEATWPGILGSKPRRPFAREDWDELWGNQYDVVTDLASPLVPELIKAYPNAKVVIVQRDFDRWWHSLRTNIIDKVWSPRGQITGVVLPIVLGIRPVQALQKSVCGFFGASSRAELTDACARRAYDAYFKQVREMVPKERLLEYKLGDGWEPLCNFLEVPVPDVPFPRTNDGDDLAKAAQQKRRQYVTFTIQRIQNGLPMQFLSGCFVMWMALTLASWWRSV
ncbi:hypothetical protein F5Y18DRAFT_8648 [Xylariaceae sp. FL1019]|nr:hypothetical protein F5Y18DRAFT_8648 [Xylariaceae sp. FL1019]